MVTALIKVFARCYSSSEEAQDGSSQKFSRRDMFEQSFEGELVSQTGRKETI